MSLGYVLEKDPKERLKQFKELEKKAMDATDTKVTLNSVEYPVEDFKLEWNRGLRFDQGYGNSLYVRASSNSSFTFSAKFQSTSDFIKAMGEIAPGKPLIISGNNTNVEAPKLEFSDFDFSELLGDTSGQIWAYDKEAIKMFEAPGPGDSEYRGVYSRNSHGVMARASGGAPNNIEEGQVVGIATSTARQGDMITFRVTSSMTMPTFQFPAIENIMKDIKKMKKKYDSWVTFEEKTGHWNRTIIKAMSGGKKALKKMEDLSDRSVCIMGKAFGGDLWGTHGDKPCSACETLGTSLLHLFTRPTEGYGYYPTVMERYEEYKMMFEWHWNNAHAGH